MRDPVIVHTVCGHTACRTAFQSRMDTASSNCPVYETVLTSRNASPNAPFQAMIENLQAMQAEREAKPEAKLEAKNRRARKCSKQKQKKNRQGGSLVCERGREDKENSAQFEMNVLKDCKLYEQEKPHKTFLVLISSCLVDRTQALNQRRGLELLRAKKISFETLDGGDPDMRMRRNELFKICGIKVKYPQFFLLDEDGSTSYFGDWNKLENINEASSMPRDVLWANPQIETWDSIFG
mmetsp:Transcript_10804/g.31994  ORF Transcript_10804/g.31994 Transcript_10804/m.31994 type:complete len:238 (+) Transcript_10804:606-1319(+)